MAYTVNKYDPTQEVDGCRDWIDLLTSASS